MIVPIPTGTKFRTTMTGREIREVVCDKSGTEYVHIVQARATGTGSNVLFLDADRAFARSKGAAKQKLKQQLRKLMLPVPCPDCGWYQKHMVELLRRRRLYRMLAIASPPLIWLALKWCLTSPDSTTGLNASLWLSVSAGLAAGAAVVHFALPDNTNQNHSTATGSKGPTIAMRKSKFEKLRAASGEKAT